MMTQAEKEDDALPDYLAKAKNIKSFKDLNLDDRLKKAVAKVKWSKPTLVQSATVLLAAEGKDIVCKSKTGSGKTGAYALSALQNLLNQNPPTPLSVLVLVPTKTLASQTTKVFKSLTKWASQISVVNLSQCKTPESVRTVLLQQPHILIGTPSSVLGAVKAAHLSLAPLSFLVLDEADLQFSYGYSGDLTELRQNFPAVKQTLLMSATMSKEVEGLCLSLNNPVNVDTTRISEKEAKLEQFVIKCGADDKFLLLYTLLKLNLIRGKSIIFVSDTNRCYQVKLFLEQFSISSCILNLELPANCVAHAIDQFNRGVYDIILASDEHNNKDHSIARGVDFQCVDNILNFDFPTTPQQYVHRVGRTARAFNTGSSLTFITPSNTAKWEELQTYLGAAGHFKSYNTSLAQLEGFRYRCKDALRAVTRTVIQETRRREIKLEIMNSEKLRSFFTENPGDLEVLRHDKVLKPREVKAHLAAVPDYLIPAALRQNVRQQKKRKERKVDFSKKRIGNYKGQASKRKADPLKSFKVKKNK